LTHEAKRAFLTAVEKTHGQGLRRFLSARMRNAADVPDLVQEVFLRLLRVEDHETIRNPQAYLYTIASHVLHQHALCHSTTTESVRFTDVVAELSGMVEHDPSLQVDTEQRFEAMGRALERHSPNSYATLVLHRCDGIPLKEIAPLLGVSYTMVKRYLAQALTYCQQWLEEIDRESL
jgi:RNA polymerase sigma factor (sigma-70 family)